MKLRFPRLAYNWITFAGVALALVAGATLAVLFGIAYFVEEQTNPYFGVFLYLLGPPVLLVGLLLIPLGMYRELKRRKREGEAPARALPVLDLNEPRHRKVTIYLSAGTFAFALMAAVGSYSTYHYSESVSFCGETCHTVMEPEYTTYHNSPHARVACSECHIGPGADWFVKSKISGLYQVWATFRDIYPRPIPTPIKSLRPAQDTCEQCHWPEKVFGAQQHQFDHYKYDEENSPWRYNLLLKTGGGNPATGQTSGIHWHMNIGARVDYIARDENRQDIPWVRVTDLQTGRMTVYQNEGDPLSEEEIATASPRTMDCMDCHNRPSHIFRSPDAAIDLQILQGKIDRTIPSVKRIAVEAMAAEYETREEALRSIADEMTLAYREDYPGYYRANEPAVERAIVATQEAYSNNIFPAMNTNWSVYEDNIGHFESPGCMRCHEGRHVSAGGVVLSRECDICHTILGQSGGEVDELAAPSDGLEFRHPEDIGEMWRDTGCYECHGGTQP